MIFRCPLNNEEVLKQASTIAQKHLSGIKGIEFFLFGSRVSGKHHSKSDYDFGIIASAKLDIRKFSALQEDLENLPVLQQIEVVDFSKVTNRFREIAVQHVKILFKN